MKKNGFTLAEVLITLTIIGVVAVLTLPALMTNVQEQQAKTALRKMANTMTNAAALSNAIEGYDYSNITAASSTDDLGKEMAEVPSLLNLIASRASINRNSTIISDATGCKVGGMMQAVFNDGTRVYFPSKAPDATTGKMQKDGLHRGFICVFDTNGPKGPNQISNCVPTTTGITTTAADDSANCKSKTNRVFKDQYLMVLRGTKVDPIGAASVYMMTDSTGVPAAAFKSTGDSET